MGTTFEEAERFPMKLSGIEFGLKKYDREMRKEIRCKPGEEKNSRCT